MTSPFDSAPQAGQVGASFCAACGAALAPGARYCHRCGQPVGQPVPATRASTGGGATPINVAAALPWGIAFVALLAIVAAFAGRNIGRGGDTPADSSAATFPLSPAGGSAGASAPDPASAAAAPSIANLTPSERARRLYDRLMRYADAGKTDSINFFAPMALASHSLLDAPTSDERYHYGRVAEVTGHADVAAAQADTMLQKHPSSLLGLVLAGRAARLAGNSAAANGFDQRLLKALDSERAKNNPEDEEHRADIDRAVADARRRS